MTDRRPLFGMPVLVPPDTIEPDGYYDGLPEKSVTVRAGEHNLLEIRLDSAADRGVYAMTDGAVMVLRGDAPLEAARGTSWYLGPEGVALTDSADDVPEVPATWALILTVWTEDYLALESSANPESASLPLGVPAPTMIHYLNMDPERTTAALRAAVEQLNDYELRWGARDLGGSLERSAQIQRYLERVLAGETMVPVTGRTRLGEAARIVDQPVLGLRLLDGLQDLFSILHLRAMPDFDEDLWEAHPLLEAIDGPQWSWNAELHLRFEQIDTESMATYGMANVRVDMVREGGLIHPVLQTRTTDEHGQVTYLLEDVQALGRPDVFFLIHVPGYDDPWSTKKWCATDGTSGCLESFYGARVGSAGEPVVFRVGLFMHVQIGFDNYGHGTSVAPCGLPIVLTHEDVWGSTNEQRSTLDIHGKAVFRAPLTPTGSELVLNIPAEITDSSVSLPRTIFPYLSLDVYCSNWLGESIGAPAEPLAIDVTDSHEATVLRVLKSIREAHELIWRLTGGRWEGVLNLSLVFLSGPYYSNIARWIDLPDTANRSTCIHEFAHAALEDETGTSIVEDMLAIRLHHEPDRVTDEVFALKEGWPEFMELVANGMYSQPTLNFPSAYYDASFPVYCSGERIPLGPIPGDAASYGRGECVEGVFAYALWRILVEMVLCVRDSDVPLDSASPNVLLPESEAGYLGDGLPEGSDAIIPFSLGRGWYLDAGAQSRFQQYIYDPLHDTSPDSTTELIAAILSMNPDDVHKLLRIFQGMNMAMRLPDIGGIIPASASPVGDGPEVELQIEGENFVDQMTTFIFSTIGDGDALDDAVLEVKVVSSTQAKVTVDLAHLPEGEVSVAVSTRAGSSPRSVSWRRLP